MILHFQPPIPFGIGTLSPALRPRAAQVPNPQLLCLGITLLPDCSLVRAVMDLMFPSGMPLLSLDAVLQGDAIAPLSRVGEHPPPVQPLSRETALGMGERAKFLPFSG